LGDRATATLKEVLHRLDEQSLNKLVKDTPE
jgi:hypothetical protein